MKTKDKHATTETKKRKRIWQQEEKNIREKKT